MKLIITMGLPASGKTTWAKEQVEKSNGKIKRINRDDLRSMIDNGIWSKEREKNIKHCEKQLAGMYLVSGCDVIVDNTHLSPKIETEWRQFAECMHVDFEIKDFTHVPITECLKRDQKRPNYVGEKVIKKMYNQFLATPPANVEKNNLLPCWIFDIDGTLALHTSRGPFEFELCESDTVNESVRAIMNLIKEPRYIFLISGREDTYRPHTERWLRANEIDYTDLYMRKTADKRNDDIVKREIYEAMIHGKFKVMGIFDDRLRVVRMWHGLGLPVYKIGDPDADF